MVADTYDPLLGLLEMGTGNQNNSWGSSFNASMTTMVARAIAGSASRVLTGGTLDLSGSPPPAGPRQDIDYMQIISGVLASNQTIIVPNLTKTWYFFNGTTGAFKLFVQISGGNTVQIPVNTGKVLLATSSGVLLRMDREEVGRIFDHGGASPPNGAFACNGASLVRTDHPDLFNVIGTIWGAVDGTHFTLPNFQDTGRFRRSSSGSLTVGTYQSNQNKSHTHTGSGSTSAMSANASHNHTGSGTTSGVSAFHTHTYGRAGGSPVGAGGSFGFDTALAVFGNVTSTDSVDHTHTYSFTTSSSNIDHTHTYSFTTSTGSADGTEARPEAAVVLACINY